MKCIKAVIQHHVLPLVIRSLEEVPNFPGMTLQEVLGRSQSGDTAFLLSIDNIPLRQKWMIQIVTGDELVSEISTRILKAARTGKQGDGLITVAALESAVRIRSGEALDAAA